MNILQINDLNTNVNCFYIKKNTPSDDIYVFGIDFYVEAICREIYKL